MKKLILSVAIALSVVAAPFAAFAGQTSGNPAQAATETSKKDSNKLSTQSEITTAEQAATNPASKEAR